MYYYKYYNIYLMDNLLSYVLTLKILGCVKDAVNGASGGTRVQEVPTDLQEIG